MNIVETQDEGEDLGFTLGVLCEMETEVNSVQLDNEFFLYKILFTVLNVQNKIGVYPSGQVD